MLQTGLRGVHFRFSRLNYGDILHITLPSLYLITNFCVEVEDIYVWPLYDLESYYGVTRISSDNAVDCVYSKRIDIRVVLRYYRQFLFYHVMLLLVNSVIQIRRSRRIERWMMMIPVLLF